MVSASWTGFDQAARGKPYAAITTPRLRIAPATNCTPRRLKSARLRVRRSAASSDGLRSGSIRRAPYPAELTASRRTWLGMGEARRTAARSVARLTLAASTPGMRLNERSTRATHEAHVIPSIAMSSFLAAVGIGDSGNRSLLAAAWNLASRLLQKKELGHGRPKVGQAA